MPSGRFVPGARSNFLTVLRGGLWYADERSRIFAEAPLTPRVTGVSLAKRALIRAWRRFGAFRMLAKVRGVVQGKCS
jgi:hypothetical protein